jgi:SpoVK/Ycf46/Vps4 family AAA+-type ATPase
LSENFVKKFKISRSIVFSQALNSRFYEIIKPDQIEEKRLIYPVEIQKRIDLYLSKISKRSFPEYIVQMKKNKLPQNFTIMIYGESGVGKTELVKQLAKRYDRPILNVKLSELRTMWFGESERLVTILFAEIRQATIELGIEPIVLFNEADGFFQNRTANKSYKNETNTNIVTILLNELEKFEGILIATSNYTNSIDIAFERRFALKLHVPKPDSNTIRELIRDKLNIRDNDFIQHISNSYNISPAEIENVKMKSLILDVMPDDKEVIEELIRSECNGWSLESRNTIGFNNLI